MEGAVAAGEWAKPVWPSNRSLQGSPPTPYIFDDRCSYEDVADKILEWYNTDKKERDEAGLKGREFAQDPRNRNGITKWNV